MQKFESTIDRGGAAEADGQAQEVWSPGFSRLTLANFWACIIFDLSAQLDPLPSEAGTPYLLWKTLHPQGSFAERGFSQWLPGLFADDVKGRPFLFDEDQRLGKATAG